MKSFFKTIIIFLIVVFSLFSFSCSAIGENGNSETQALYQSYVSYLTELNLEPLSYEEWIVSIKGEKGDKGDKGDDGTAGEKSNISEIVEKVKRTSVALKTESGRGSGVLVDMGDYSKLGENEFYVITCHHMISKMGDFILYIPDLNDSYDNADYIFAGKIGPEIYGDIKVKTIDWGDVDLAVTLVGGDKDSDIALLKLNLNKKSVSGKLLDPDKLVLANLPSKEYKMRMGEQIFAIGNPTGGLPGTLSTGYVSYIERKNVNISDVGNMNLMQIDVSTNPGNSGGGLYNVNGDLIGITNAGNTSYSNINFAIPYVLSNGNGFVNIARQFIETASDDNYGYVETRRQKFGFTTSQVVNDSKDGYDLIITEITVGSLSESVGMKVDDKVISVKLNDGEYVFPKVLDEFSGVIATAKFDDVVTVKVYRQSESREIEFSMTVKPFRFCDTGK